MVIIKAAAGSIIIGAPVPNKSNSLWYLKRINRNGITRTPYPAKAMKFDSLTDARRVTDYYENSFGFVLQILIVKPLPRESNYDGSLQPKKFQLIKIKSKLEREVSFYEPREQGTL